MANEQVQAATTQSEWDQRVRQQLAQWRVLPLREIAGLFVEKQAHADKDAKRIAELERIVETTANNNAVLMDNATGADRKIEELERVTGPVMPCGCYAVTMHMSYEWGEVGKIVRCLEHGVKHEVTPEYLAWKASRWSPASSANPGTASLTGTGR